ncbi:Citrate lyase subunit beta-like protein [Moraxella caprae]|uniref:Citrate lyase subunit beta-like protein n=1 Tax=Moraxella caprae TaxID=90240 RepID=A0A378R366_9GAMM|nr:CoA ester lyase [Moraxella caprae]STZ09644.1 Citrate lyase subunit beta-like protein [Moraxella caprae]
MLAYLFVPATHPKRIIKALTDPAITAHVHAIIIDLEDAAADRSPNDVRAKLDDLLGTMEQTQTMPELWVRIHGASHGEFRLDCEWVRSHDIISTVVLPKAENAEQVSLAHELTARPVVAMIESGQGVLNVASMAGAVGLVALSYGCLDLLTSLGMTMNTKASALMFDKIRTELVLHSQANELSAPIETIYPNFQDDGGFKAWLTHAQNFGFGGVLAIHPKQLAIISSLNEREGDLCFAKKVLSHHDSTGEAVFAIDGQMVDLPVITWAREILGK